MGIGNVDDEIDRLKAKKIEITSRMNLASNFDDKEEMQNEIKRIQKQIEMLERFK
jgi:hypothetical protein